MPYTSTTLGDLQTLMAQRWDTEVFWTPEEARLALNEALREWNLLTGRWRTRVTLNVNDPVWAITPPFSDVRLPGVLTYAMRVTTADGQPLHPTSIAELDYGRPQWSLETTASGGDVPTRPLLWAPTSLTQINIWPTLPAFSPAALLCDGVLATPVVTVAADTVNLGEIIDVVVDFALHIAAFKEAAPAGARPVPTSTRSSPPPPRRTNSSSSTGLLAATRDWTGLGICAHPFGVTQLRGVASQFSRHDPTGGGA